MQGHCQSEPRTKPSTTCIATKDADTTDEMGMEDGRQLDELVDVLLAYCTVILILGILVFCSISFLPTVIISERKHAAARI